MVRGTGSVVGTREIEGAGEGAEDRVGDSDGAGVPGGGVLHQKKKILRKGMPHKRLKKIASVWNKRNVREKGKSLSTKQDKTKHTHLF